MEIMEWDMKKILAFFIICAAFFALSSFFAGAESGRGEYVISEDGGEYLLSVYSDGALTPVMKSDDISLAMEYINSLNASANLFLKDLTVNEDLIICAMDICVTGSALFSEAASLIVTGGNFTADNLFLTFNDGCVMVNEGALLFENSEITSGGVAVTMDFSAGATAYFESGKVIGQGSSGAMLLKTGRAFIGECSVYNERGVAIKNSTTLTLASGADIKGGELDIYTQCPVTLSGEDEFFSSALRVKYAAMFKEGSINCVFYSATPALLENIRFFDYDGVEYPLRFFYSHESVRDKNFGAVYLPYTVNFFADGVLVGTREIVGNMKISGMGAPKKAGYDFLGWTAGDSDELFDFAVKTDSDLNLYAKYRLLAPEFQLSSLSFSYDGREHEFGINSLSHPLLESGIVSYSWYFNGTQLPTSASGIKLSRVSESGEYYCVLSFSYGTDTVKVTTPTVEVEIKKAVIPIPTVPSKSYSGEYQSADIPKSSYYSSTPTGGVEVGVYPVALEISDSENCEFSSGKSVECVDFKIEKAENGWLEELSVIDIYQGMAPSSAAISRFGEVKYQYSDRADGGFSSQYPTTAGEYFCIAFVEGCENYGELYSAPVSFMVIAESVSAISILRMPEKTDYIAFDAFISDGLLLSVTYNSSRVEAVGAADISISYQSAESLRYGDTGVIVGYRGALAVVPISVDKAEYDLSGIYFESENLVFNGTRQSLKYYGILPTGLDGIPLSATVSGGGVGVGSYSVSLIFSSDSRNYKIPESIERTLTVLPYKTVAVFSDTEFVYSGKEVCPSAYCLDIYGRRIDLSVEGKRTLAGEYSAKAHIDDVNYILDGDTTSFVILKANYDFSEVTWICDDFIYDGKEKSVYLSGLPSGVSVIGYGDNLATVAGTYTARATVSYDERNYNKPPELYFEWRIRKAEYDISAFSFSDAQFVYDGKLHYPTLIGEMPVGVDGIALRYKFSGGATHVNDGRVCVDITFDTESENYILPQKTVAYVEILPLGITVEWGSTDFVYNSSLQIPTARSSVAAVTVLGANTDAGKYVATAISRSSDYFIINSTVEYRIDKANNFWISELSVSSVFEGNAPSPRAECLGGEASYIYYSHDGVELSEIPSLSGVYYVKAVGDGGNNYKSISSNLLKFEIIAILPVSISVEAIKEEYFAFERIADGDVLVTVWNNDGSTKILPFSELTVSYEADDSLRFSDKFVYIEWCGFSEKVSVSVEKADYDISEFVWSSGELIYDGNEKRVFLSSLPSGVSVNGYEGSVGINAGEYIAVAKLSYDEENFNPPPDIRYVWYIERQTVKIPDSPRLEYSGKMPEIILDGSELFFCDISVGKNTGRYPITLTLKDSENYEFDFGGTEAVIYYEIYPRSISVKLFDVEKYLFEEIPEPEYKIVGGEIVDGDEVPLSFNYSENEVYCVSENPNYTVRTIPGNIIRRNTVSEDRFFIIFVSFSVTAILGLSAVIITLKRREIAQYMHVLRCKLSPIERGAQGENNDSGNACEETCKTVKIEHTLSVDAERADSLISDSLAKNLLRKDDERIESEGRKKRIINVDTLNDNFSVGERIDVNVLKQKDLIPYDTAYIKVLARGVVDKPLRVYANDFSLSAVKMIALSGGEAIKVITVRKNKGLRKTKNSAKDLKSDG